jgi:hypothetical protein
MASLEEAQRRTAPYVPVALADGTGPLLHPRLQLCLDRLREYSDAVDMEFPLPGRRHEEAVLRSYWTSSGEALAHEGTRIALVLEGICKRLPHPSKVASAKSAMAKADPAMFGTAAPPSKAKAKGKPVKRKGKAAKVRIGGPDAEAAEGELDTLLGQLEHAADRFVAGAQHLCRGHCETFRGDVRNSTKRVLDGSACVLLSAVPPAFQGRELDSLTSLAVSASAGKLDQSAKALSDLAQHDGASAMRRLVKLALLTKESFEEMWGGDEEPPPRPKPEDVRGMLFQPADHDDEETHHTGAGSSEDGEWSDGDFDDMMDDDEWKSDPVACERWWRAQLAYRQFGAFNSLADSVMVNCSKMLRADLSYWRPDLRVKGGASKAAAASSVGASSSSTAAKAVVSLKTQSHASEESTQGEEGDGWWWFEMPVLARRELQLRYAWLDMVSEAFEHAANAMITFGDAATDTTDPVTLARGACEMIVAVGHLIEAMLPGATLPGVHALWTAAKCILEGQEIPAEVAEAARDLVVPDHRSGTGSLLQPTEAFLRAVQALAGTRASELASLTGRPPSAMLTETTTLQECLPSLVVTGVEEERHHEFVAALRRLGLPSSSGGSFGVQRTEERSLDTDTQEREEGDMVFDTPETVPDAARGVAESLGAPCEWDALPDTDPAAFLDESEPSTEAATTETAAVDGAHLSREQLALQTLLGDAACIDPLTAWNLQGTAFLAMQRFASSVPELEELGIAPQMDEVTGPESEHFGSAEAQGVDDNE